MFAFAVWLMWSVIAVRIRVAHDLDSSKYAYGMTNTDKREYQGMLYLLPCLAGISGACFRIINASPANSIFSFCPRDLYCVI
jgi:hypothetical protein